VSARDDTQLVGEGTHERFRIVLERFLARLPKSPEA
jgi:predicted thioesterase